MKDIVKLKPLYKRDTKGKVRIWEVEYAETDIAGSNRHSSAGTRTISGLVDGKKVTRVEFTTSCQYPYYSLVAGGHYFKPTRADRFKHRYYHKLVGYLYQIEKLGCVGCGRCSAECPAKISMVETIKRLRGTTDEEEFREASEQTATG